MAPPVRGAGATVGFGLESVWGTGVARTNWKEVTKVGVRRIITNKQEPDLGRRGDVSTNRRYSFVESDFAGGPIELVAAYDDSTIGLLTQILGAVDTTGVSSPWTHLVTLASPGPLGFTLEQINGTGNGELTGMAEIFTGCKCAGGKLSMSAGGLLMVETEIIGRTSGGLEAMTLDPDNDYSPGGERIKHRHMGPAELGGTEVALTGWTIEVQRDLQRNQELGSELTSEPFEGDGGVQVKIELRTKWQRGTFDAAYLAGTHADLVIPFTGSGVKRLNITAHNAQVDDVSREVSTRGAVEQIVKLTAYSDGTNQGLALEFKNGNASAGAN